MENNSFYITHYCDEDDLRFRPRASYKARVYLCDFFLKNILVPKSILVNKWNVNLSISFGMVKKESEIIIAPSRKFSQEKTILFPAMVPLNNIIGSQDPYKDYLEIIIDVIWLFILENSNNVSRDELEQVIERIDYEFLYSLPYPAPFIEQKFIGDDSVKIQKLYFEKFDL
ncbi:MAG: hypothetical protein JJU02_15890 [Cryomorphaceae bacterium]|nr:hypothetical protein [Cryomorphaceae bacterium]